MYSDIWFFHASLRRFHSTSCIDTPPPLLPTAPTSLASAMKPYLVARISPRAAITSTNRSTSYTPDAAMSLRYIALHAPPP
jgi:hypothetical protein